MNYHQRCPLRPQSWRFSVFLELIVAIAAMNNHKIKSLEHILNELKMKTMSMEVKLNTWTALSTDFSGILQGNAKDDDCGLLETHPGLLAGHALIFLQIENFLTNESLEEKSRYLVN